MKRKFKIEAPYCEGRDAPVCCPYLSALPGDPKARCWAGDLDAEDRYVETDDEEDYLRHPECPFGDRTIKVRIKVGD